MSDARKIVAALKGHWGGRSGSCRCPAHDDRSPSLSVTQTTDGRPLVFCHAGCEQRSVIDALKNLTLWPHGNLIYDPSSPHRLTIAHEEIDAQERERRETARRLWDHTVPIARTLAEIYIKARGIRICLPDCLRFHPNLKHTETKRSWPCMVAAIHDSAGRVTAVQRTYLEPDGHDRIRPADGSKGKKTLGPMGDGAVRLGTPYGVLGLAEGIETALSAKQLYGVAVWATLSAHRLGSIAIPEGVQEVWIFADAGRVGLVEAQKAVSIYADQGYRCLIQLPPDGSDDHNAALMAMA